MNSLTELNGYVSNLSIEYTDNRAANVTFTTPTAVNQSQSVDEGFTLGSSVGIEIDEVLNATVSAPTYTINLFNLAGASLTWPTLPSGVTASTPSTRVYRLSGISSKAVWDAVKVATISMPATYNGVWTYTSTIAYYSQTDGNQTRSWTTAVTVNDVIFLTTPLEFNYSASSTALITNGTQIVDLDASYPGVTWTVVGTPTNNASISNWTTTGTGGTFSVNGTTKVFTITGTRAQVNSRLAELTLTTNSQDTDFSVNYAVSNGLNSITDNAIQTFKSYNLTKLNNTSPSYFIEDANFINISGTPSVIDTPYDGTGTYNLAITPSTTSAVTSMSSNPLAKTFTNAGTAVNSTAQFKFGTASMYSNGAATSYISTNINLDDFNFGADDFTIDFWIRIPVVTASGGIMGKISSSQYGSHLGWSIALQNGYVEFLGGYTPPGNFSPLNGINRAGITSRLSANTWTHIAFSCKDGVLSTYKNGAREQQTALTTIADSTGNLQIGKGYYLNGGLNDDNGFWRETWTAVTTAATLTPVRNVNSSIDSLTITSGGSGFTSAPTIIISAPQGGSAAVLTAVRNTTTNRITSIAINSGGSGYATAPTLTISGGGGSGATAVATVSSTGIITSVTVTNQGTNYTSNPSVAISSTNNVQATATATVTDGVITAISVTNAGAGYTSNPTITLSGGTTVNGILNGYLDELRVSDNARYVDDSFTPFTGAYSWDSNTKLLLHFNGANNSTSFTDDVDTLGQLGTESFNNSTKVLTLSGTRTQVNGRLNYLRAVTSVDWGSDFALTYFLTTPREETATKVQSMICGSNDIEITNMNVSRAYTANRANQIFSSSTPFISDFDDDDETNVYTIGFTSSLGQFAFGLADIPVTSLTFSGNRAQCNAKFSDVRFYPTVGVYANGTFTYTQIKNGVTQISQSVALTGTYATYNNARSFIFTTSQTYTPTPADLRYGNWEIAVVGAGGTPGAPYLTTPPYNNFASQGGGGGGEVIQQSNVTITNQTYSIVIGAPAAVFPQPGYQVGDGGNTSAFGLTARGGKQGIGIIHISSVAGNDYTRTGGASGNGNLGGIARYYYDNNGNNIYRGGGGGGAGAGYTSELLTVTLSTEWISGSRTSIHGYTTDRTFTNVSLVGGSGTGGKATVYIQNENGPSGSWNSNCGITITNAGSGYQLNDIVSINVSSLLPGYISPGEDIFINLTGAFSIYDANPIGKIGVGIFWDASANSMYGYYGGGGAGASAYDPADNLGSGAIGNLISNPVSHTNGITTSKSTGYYNNSGGGGSYVYNMLYAGSGVVGVRITSKG